MNICLYTGSALPKLGGQEAVVDALARQFLKLGHEPTVLAPRPRLPMWPNDSQLPYRVIRHPRFFSTRHFVSWYQWFLLRANRRHHFDIIHCHDVYPTGYVASLCKPAMEIPLVITSHGGDVRAGNARLSKSGMQQRFTAAVQSSDALISIGRFTQQGFEQLGADQAKIHTIPNGVDLAPFAKPATRPDGLDPRIEPRNYLLFLGRLSHRKGLDLLIRALSMMQPTGSVDLVVAGSGAENHGGVGKLIAQYNIGDRVRFVGRVSGDTKTWLLQNASAVVMPSRGWEAFPLVVLEAYAAGRPVIGSRIAGLEDVIIENETGLLFEPESVTDLANALRRVREDANWVRTAGETARLRAADYGWDRIAEQHIMLYRTCAHIRS